MKKEIRKRQTASWSSKVELIAGVEYLRKQGNQAAGKAGWCQSLEKRTWARSNQLIQHGGERGFRDPILSGGGYWLTVTTFRGRENYFSLGLWPWVGCSHTWAELIRLCVCVCVSERTAIVQASSVARQGRRHWMIPGWGKSWAIQNGSIDWSLEAPRAPKTLSAL